MRKEETAKLYNHIFYTLLHQPSITNVGYETQNLLNGVTMLYHSGIMSHRDFTNMTGYIIGLAEDQIKILNYERLKNDDEKV